MKLPWGVTTAKARTWTLTSSTPLLCWLLCQLAWFLFFSMEEECLSKISIQGGPTSVHCDPNDKNFKKEVRTLKLLPSSLRATWTSAYLNQEICLCLYMCVEIVDLPSSPFLSSNRACQSRMRCWAERQSVYGGAQRNYWPCSESCAGSCHRHTSHFCLTQTVHWDNFMSWLILWHDLFHLHIWYSTCRSSFSLLDKNLILQGSYWDYFHHKRLLILLSWRQVQILNIPQGIVN